MRRFTKALMTGAMAIAAAGLVETSAMATDGYFAHGTGARQKALGGAGVADGNDATSIALNPAGLVRSDHEFSFSGSIFSPQRSANVNTADYVESAGDVFLIPNFAYNYKIDANSALGVSMYASGGMNTDYEMPKGVNEFSFGTTSLYSNLEQTFLSVAYAKKMGNFAFGVAPIFAAQNFEVKGLQNYAAFGWSSDPANMTNKGRDWSFGGGLRAGIEWEVMDGLRFGAAGNTRIYMSKFEKYKGLFAEQGSFDIPASLQVGLAADVQPNLTVMFDYKRIFYGDIKAISNSGPSEAEGDVGLFGAPNAGHFLGQDGGIGFGWEDLNIFKVGVEWDATPDTTWRFGYSYNDQPLNSDDLVFNVIAPATVQHHITAGMKTALTDNIDFELAGMYAPEKKLTGQDHSPNDDFGGDDQVGLKMSQWELTAGVVWKLGGNYK